MTTPRSIALSTFRLGAWRALAEPTLLLFGGEVIGTFTPAEGFVDPTEAVSSGFKEIYRVQPTVEIEVAKLALEIAELSSELEELRMVTAPDALRSSRSSSRHREALRRRGFYVALLEQHQKGEGQ